MMLKKIFLVCGVLVASFVSTKAADLTPSLDFTEARMMAHSRSDILKMHASETARREYETESARSLHGPKVTLEFRELWGQKDVDFGTMSVPLGKIGIPSSLNIPLKFSQDLYGPRLTGSVELPLYMGGAIEAKVAASEGSVRESRADEAARRDKLDAELAQRYFGVQLARSVESLRRSMLRQQNEELNRAERFRKTGSLSKVEQMSVAVNRDEAARELLAAQTDTKIAENDLARFMREPSVGRLKNPLFVLSGPIGALSEWKAKAERFSPVFQSVNAKRYQAEQGLKAARAAWAPQVYAFARGNAIKHYLSITEPDWVAGIGVKFTLWDNRDRNASMAAARSVIDKAEAGISEAHNQIEQAVESAYLRTCQTQEQYRLTLSTLELARENLRLRKRAFSEGLSTATELNEARTKLLGAEIARRLAAYRFVVAWASLNAVCGTPDEFVTSIEYKTNFFEN